MRELNGGELSEHDTVTTPTASDCDSEHVKSVLEKCLEDVCLNN